MFKKEEILMNAAISIAKGPGSKLSFHDYIKDKYSISVSRLRFLLAAKQLEIKVSYIDIRELQRVLHLGDFRLKEITNQLRKSGFVDYKSDYLLMLSERSEQLIEDVLDYQQALIQGRMRSLAYAVPSRATRGSGSGSK